MKSGFSIAMRLSTGGCNDIIGVQSQRGLHQSGFDGEDQARREVLECGGCSDIAISYEKVIESDVWVHSERSEKPNKNGEKAMLSGKDKNYGLEGNHLD